MQTTPRLIPCTIIFPPRPMPSVFMGLWEPDGRREPGRASPRAGGEGTGGSRWDAAAAAPSSLGSPPASPGARRAGERVRLDVGPAAARGHVCACEHIDIYVTLTPSSGGAPRGLLPSPSLGTELSNPSELPLK